MTNSEFKQFETALNELACCYLRKLDGSELAAYFKQLARYPAETVLKAMKQAPELYPTFVPTAGQIGEICESIIAAERPVVDAVTLLRGVNDCEHDDEFQPEPEGGLYVGFDVCAKCGR